MPTETMVRVDWYPIDLETWSREPDPICQEVWDHRRLWMTQKTLLNNSSPRVIEGDYWRLPEGEEPANWKLALEPEDNGKKVWLVQGAWEEDIPTQYHAVLLTEEPRRISVVLDFRRLEERDSVNEGWNDQP